MDRQFLDSRTDLRDLERRGACDLSRESSPASSNIPTQFIQFKILLWDVLVHEGIQPYSWLAFVEAQPGNQIMLCGETALTAAQP